MDLKDAIKKFFRGDVLDDPKTLSQYSHDASIFTLTPKLVVFPKDLEDLKGLISFVQLPGNHHLSITPRSAGTDMSGGAITEGIIMDMTRYFNKIGEIGTDFGVGQPGVYYRDFEKETLKQQMIMPSYPASKNIAALGGIVADNAGGEKTLTFGKTANFIESLKVVLADGNEYSFSPLSKSQLDKKMEQQDFEGEVYKKLFELINKNYDLIQKARPAVSKNSSGYFLWDVWDKSKFDLTQLFCGSQGTLGIITEIKFKLVKVKPHSTLRFMFQY